MATYLTLDAGGTKCSAILFDDALHMTEVEGIEARYAAASGISSDHIMWSLTSVAVEELLCCPTTIPQSVL